MFSVCKFQSLSIRSGFKLAKSWHRQSRIRKMQHSMHIQCYTYMYIVWSDARLQNAEALL